MRWFPCLGILLRKSHSCLSLIVEFRDILVRVSPLTQKRQYLKHHSSNLWHPLSCCSVTFVVFILLLLKTASKSCALPKSWRICTKTGNYKRKMENILSNSKPLTVSKEGVIEPRAKKPWRLGETCCFEDRRTLGPWHEFRIITVLKIKLLGRNFLAPQSYLFFLFVIPIFHELNLNATLISLRLDWVLRGSCPNCLLSTSPYLELSGITFLQFILKINLNHKQQRFEESWFYYSNYIL